MTAPTPVRKAGSVFALGIRAGILLPNGTPARGADMAFETDNLVKIDFTVEYRDGTEVERLNGAAKACLYYSSPPTVKRLTIDGLEICYPDPELEQLLGGGDVLLDAGGRPIGYAAPEVGSDPVPNGVSIEAWSSAIADDGVDPELPYMWWVFPREYLKPSGRSMSAEPMAAAFEGQGNQNPNWGAGPSGDWDHESGRVYQWVRVPEIPDLAGNGFVAVPAP